MLKILFFRRFFVLISPISCRNFRNLHGDTQIWNTLYANNISYLTFGILHHKASVKILF